MRWACHEEFPAFLDCVPSTPCRVGPQCLLALLIVLSGLVQSALGFIQHILEFLRLNLVLGVLLILTQIGFGFGNESPLLVFLVLLVHESAGQTPPQELHIPLLLAIHTLGGDSVLNEVFLHALVARLILAVEALDLLVGVLVEFLNTNSAFHCKSVGHWKK